MSQTRLLRGHTETLDAWFHDPDGAGTAVTGSCLVTIVDGSGGTVVNAGTATAAGTTVPGQYEYDHKESAVDLLTATWTAVVGSGTAVVETFAEVVGRHLFTIAEARAWDNSDGSTGALNSTTVYPTSAILEERDRITDLLEQWTNRSWVPRYVRLEVAGTGTRFLSLTSGVPVTAGGDPAGGPGWKNGPWRVLSATADGAAVTAGNIKVNPRSGELYRTDTVWPAATDSSPFNVVLELEYGEPRNVDGVERIALLLLRDRLVKSDLPDGAISITGEYGNISLVQPGGPMANVSRIPEVNAWVADHTWDAYLG